MVWSLVIVLIILNWVVLLRLFAISQQNNYIINLKNKTVLKYWLKLALASLPAFAAIFLRDILAAIAAIEGAYIIICIIWLGKYLNYRTKLNFTYRAAVTYAVSGYIPTLTYILLALLIENTVYVLSVISTIFFILPLYQKLVFMCINPVFERKNKNYIVRQINKLNEKNIIKIAITGSFGKTSCKNILKTILSTKYKVYATPSNYNTPMGIALSIEEMPMDTEIFIMEMGARRVGDIRTLCDYYQPDFGIITGVCDQHLETFGTIENIYNEKFALAKSLGKDGFCVFNGNNRYTLRMYKSCDCLKSLVRVNKYADVFARNISIGSYGSCFEIVRGESSIKVQTVLLGKHNIQNILMCVAMATHIGINDSDLANGISNIEFIPHRLQLIKTDSLCIIDDSYNSNITGIKYAIECLAKFDTRKVVLSQGIVETGERQKEDNIAIGRMLAKAADVIMLVGINTEYISRGITETDSLKTILKYPDFESAQKAFGEVLKKGDTLLIQNDLPDTYN